MSNKLTVRGILASAAGLILLVAPEAFASQQRERGPATQMNRSSGNSSRHSAAPPVRSSNSGGASRVDRNGPRAGSSRDNPRSSYREPRASAGSRGPHRAGGSSSASGGSGVSRDHRGHDRGHSSYGGSYGDHYYGYRGSHYGSHYGSYYYPRSPFYWYGFYYPFYYSHHAYARPYYDHYYDRGYSSGQALGALDLDVRPEKAEVYVDGRFVGVADNFDGFPSYLWLDPGTYQIAFYKEGFETITREITLPSDAVVDFNDRLVRGTAIKPEPPPEEPAAETAAATPDRDWETKAEEWRERAREYMARKGEVDRTDTMDARGEPGRVFLIVRPGDASVYLDGRFLGTGDDLSGLHSGLMVDPGEHEIEVVRPGFASESKTFSVEAGEEIDLSLRLQGGESAV